MSDASDASYSSGVPVPDLDDLRFQPLVDAAKRALPQRAPEWTDHNVSDPGITLIEACAERTDQLLYRVHRMTERQRFALLRLMGITPLPASPARITVVLARTDGTTGRREIPEGTEVRTEGEQPVVLATTAPLTLAENQSTGVVEALEQLVPVAEVLGTSDGLPGGRFATSHRPWGPGTPVAEPPFGPPLTVQVGDAVWPAVRTFAEAGPNDPVHWWDDASCEVVLGPLVPAEGGPEPHGDVPAEGTRISVEYHVYRGRKGGVPLGTPLTVVSQAGLSATAHGVLAPAEDAEDWRQALERAGLGLAPSRRAVTAADHEQIIEEHVAGLARVRVTALTRPTDSHVPTALTQPPRPAEVLACVVAARDPLRAVHYFDVGGVIAPLPLSLEGPGGEPDDGDAVPQPVADAKCLDAVIRTGEGEPRLWFYGTQCLWDGEDGENASSQDISSAFPDLPDDFSSQLDEVAVLADPASADAYELFFFKGETFYHRAYTCTDRAFVPQADSRGVRSLISEAFPGLSPQCQVSPDAVVVIGGVFFFMKGTRTEPALWRREDDPLHVLLVPLFEGDPAQAPPGDAFDVPPDVLNSVVGVVDASRLLGERLRVGKPRYHRFGIAATVRPWSSTTADRERTERAAERALRRYFHPTAGGPDGRGWPWGRRVHAGDVFTVLEAVPEVRATTDVSLLADDGDGAVPSVEVSDGGLVLVGDTVIDVDITEG
ncbi:hypothetical protein J1792_24680 [Streptomyces triculaminicus]|uniref:Baseplate assembly protein n=2 Tax=Streptomyces TaxID=1883 RepID=A0A939FTQ8_9ACTN|nr:MULTISPECIES: hypothetical protein [Streptomyces]MBO0655855.1 hypothetical protein [Streptomyces triculaminicus]QSY49869.1 hypothetical protein J3S04_01830 [Streptomyces griseocarneus]